MCKDQDDWEEPKLVELDDQTAERLIRMLRNAADGIPNPDQDDPEAA